MLSENILLIFRFQLPLSLSHHLTVTTTLRQIIFSKMAVATSPILHVLPEYDPSHPQGQSNLPPWAFEFEQAMSTVTRRVQGNDACVTSEAG